MGSTTGDHFRKVSHKTVDLSLNANRSFARRYHSWFIEQEVFATHNWHSQPRMNIYPSPPAIIKIFGLTPVMTSHSLKALWINPHRSLRSRQRCSQWIEAPALNGSWNPRWRHPEQSLSHSPPATPRSTTWQKTQSPVTSNANSKTTFPSSCLPFLPTPPLLSLAEDAFP